MEKRHLVEVLRNQARKACVVAKYRLPFSPYTTLSTRDKRVFGPVLKAWAPENGQKTIILRWHMTEWCNYRCPYCPQDHSRHRIKRDGFTAHAFDNFPVELWIEAFARHFSERRLALGISGGESMIDRKMTNKFLNAISALPNTDSIRIDTNAWWRPDQFADLDPRKIILMCTLHPSQTDIESFIDRLKSYQQAGVTVGMVNYVMDENNKQKYIEIQRRLAEIKIPLHPNPLWDEAGNYTVFDKQLMQEVLPEADFLYRTQIKSPMKHKCLYPSLAYEMDMTGEIKVGCHSEIVGNFFDASLPKLFMGPVPCPRKSCVCLDKYSFLEEVNRNVTTNPLEIYSDILKERIGISKYR